MSYLKRAVYFRLGFFVTVKYTIYLRLGFFNFYAKYTKYFSEVRRTETVLHVFVSPFFVPSGVTKQLEKRDSRLKTPLLTACCCDNAEMVQLLIRYGADIKALDVNESTALCLATQHKAPSTVQVAYAWVTSCTTSRQNG